MSTQEKPKPRIGCFSIGLIGLLCLVVALITAFLVWRSVSSKRLNTAIAALKAAGHPSSETELRATYQLPQGANPGPLWVSAGEGIPDSGPTVLKLPFIGAEADDLVMPGQPWDQLEPSRAFLDKHADQIAMLERAARTKNVARYDTKFFRDTPGGMELPYGYTHRHICRVMSMACYVHAHDGNVDGVAKSIETALRAAHSISDEPVLMGQLLSSACVAMALAQVRDFISIDFDEEQLQQLQETIREFDPQKSLLRGMEGETIHVVHGFKNPRMTGPIPPLEDAAFFVEQVAPLMNVIKKGDWPDIRKAANGVSKVAADINGGGPTTARYMLTGITLPTLAALCEAKAREAANLSVHDTLIAARLFELANDRLPETLEELVPKFLPAIPTDPFSDNGEPLVLKTEDQVTKIYSRGVDTEDDGGDGDLSNDSGSPIDMVVELKRSSK